MHTTKCVVVVVVKNVHKNRFYDIVMHRVYVSMSARGIDEKKDEKTL